MEQITPPGVPASNSPVGAPLRVPLYRTVSHGFRCLPLGYGVASGNRCVIQHIRDSVRKYLRASVPGPGTRPGTCPGTLRKAMRHAMRHRPDPALDQESRAGSVAAPGMYGIESKVSCEIPCLARGTVWVPECHAGWGERPLAPHGSRV